jgi:hypothetical protein
LPNRLTIKYGTAERQPNGPSVTIDPSAGDPLRLNDGPYSFGEIPEGGIGATTPERLAFLRDHLINLCDLWAKRSRQFVDLYFRFIGAQIERDGAAIDERLRRFGGLFARQDYAFSALRPLPRAHLPVTGRAFVCVDFAFWTGRQIVALDIVGDDARGAAWDQRRRRLDAARIRCVEIATAVVAREDPGALDTLLPPEFAAFWQAESMPSSPFKASALGELRLGPPDF